MFLKSQLSQVSRLNALSLALVGMSSLFWLAGCGSRSNLIEGEAVFDCVTAADCDQSNLCTPQECEENHCVWTGYVVCESQDACMGSECNPETGACDEFPLTTDTDGDGFKNPLPGFVPGEEGACGLDCDDTSAAAYPGGDEVCDGVDNDCDGVVDNDYNYLRNLQLQVPEIVQLASEMDGSGRRGAAYGGGVFGLSYWGRADVTNAYIQGLDDRRAPVFAQRQVSEVNAPSFGADLAWSGDAFAAVWSDPRVDENYEVYFTRFSSTGEKLGPDLRLTDAEDFSIHSRILFDQGQFAVVWDDRRDE